MLNIVMNVARKKYETAYRIRGEEEAVKYAYQKRVEQMRAKRNGPSIEEVVREANKEGLSYGEYVAKHGL